MTDFSSPIDDLNAVLLQDSGEWSPDKAKVVKSLLARVHDQINEALNVLESSSSPDDRQKLIDRLAEARTKLSRYTQDETQELSDGGQHRIVEGVFDGQQMIGADGQSYSIPANYASKSKLVEGDLLKLTIDERGNFIYKQIGPIDRVRKITKLFQDPDTQQYSAVAGNQRWKLLTAAVTYFKGQSGDEVVILIPSNSRSAWAAVENIVRQNNRD